MITDANDKDWEDFWNSVEEKFWTTSDLHAVWREMDQIEPLTPIPAVYRQILIGIKLYEAIPKRILNP